jgi:lipooligosaccharide transport system ATP-binding protein
VDGISFEVDRGKCIGLLGPNGAGKTTTMRMLMGLSTVSDGELQVLGCDARSLSRKEIARIGLVPQDDNLDPDLSVRMNLEVYGRYFGVDSATVQSRVPELLEFMQLGDRADARVMELSGGMRRRLIIARALVANPELVVLDEPTTGLDPQARVLIWKQLLALRDRGVTLLLTTHYMDEAQRLCDRIIVIDHGRILDNGTPAELIERHVKGHVFEVQKPMPDEFDENAWDCEDIGDSLLVYAEDARSFIDSVPADTQYLHRQANLEDVFLRLTGRALREN